MTDASILDTAPLGPGPWPTLDPFLFCVHHDDAYPPAGEDMAPSASLAGRNIGQDFSGKDGWSLYHGERVPGFPQHPHRGFETVTVARRGFIDHSDSLGAKARFGEGDLQWMTAGRGIVHSEMFPLLNRDRDNPTELFQIWLNLPARDKMAEPHFAMFWSDRIPVQTFADENGHATVVTSYAGALPDGGIPPPPPPRSWAAHAENHVAIWTIRMPPGGTWSLRPGAPGCNRQLFFFRGESAEINGMAHAAGVALTLAPGAVVPIANGPDESEFLLLEGRPIGEPVAQYGPFVMNSRAELQQAFEDYRRSAFGGWRWPEHGPVHPRGAGRFAQYPDGSESRPD